MVLAWIFRRIDAILGEPLQQAIGFRIPGLGFVLLLVLLVVVGWLVHMAVGRRLLAAWNHALVRFPITGRIYNAASQIVQSVISDRRRVFKRTVLVPYPTDGLWAVGFVTNEEAPVMSRIVGEPCVNVFVPTTPNPTSGFMLVVPQAKLLDAQIGVEEAMKFVISAGSVSPARPSGPILRRGIDIDTLLSDDA